MIVSSAEFTKSINGTDKILDDPRPHVVFVGRSNVGKSSIINTLTEKKHLVRTSKKPGKTKTLDFFLINNILFFVDIPGYGYADVHQEELDHLRKLILWYFEKVIVEKRIIVLIVDANVGVKEFDRQMVELSKEQKIPLVIAANKIDKVRSSKKEFVIKEIEKQLGTNEIVVFSATQGIGKQKLLQTIQKKLSLF